MSDLAMEAIKNIKMVEAAREEAKKIIEENGGIKSYPMLKERIENQDSKIHFE